MVMPSFAKCPSWLDSSTKFVETQIPMRFVNEHHDTQIVENVGTANTSFDPF